MLSRAILFGFLALAPCFALFSESSALADETPVYTKRGSWADTMVQSRAALPMPKGGDSISFGRWHTTGPIKSTSFEQIHFPEKEGGLELTAAQGKYRWRAQDGWPNGRVHPLPTKGNTHTTYLMRTITCAVPRKLDAGFGSDDGMAAWLNGVQIVDHPQNRGVAPDSDRAVLDLKQGQNKLLVKIYNQGGAHGFYFGTKATDVIGGSLGMPNLNSHTHDTINHRGWDNQICVLSDLRGEGQWQTIYTPPSIRSTTASASPTSPVNSLRTLGA